MFNYYRLEQHIEEHMSRVHVPAIAFALVNEREVIYARGFGVTSVEAGGAPVSPYTLFRIGSVTKPLLGTAVMRLVEASQLDLDRPIKEYVEGLSFSQKHAEELITLRMLLSHTAGLPSDFRDDAGDPTGLERYVREQIPRYSFVTPPGRLYSYSNGGFNLVGYIAQIVSGKPFPDLMQELIFDPLEMKHTTFDPRLVLTYPFALPHILNEGTLKVLPRISQSQAYAPSGQAYSTVLDLANFAMMHLQYGRFHAQRILSTQSVLGMHTPQAVRYMVNDAGYWPGSNTLLSVGFVAETTEPVRYIMIDGKPCERFERDPLFLPDSTSWIRFSGTYRENSNKEIITVQIEDHRLLLRLHDNDGGVTEGTCIPLGETRFAWSGGLIDFHIADDGIVPALTAMEVYTFWRV